MANENGKSDQANNSHEIFIGDWCFKPDHGILERGDKRLELRPKDSDLLVYLADHAGEVVSLDDIITFVWHGVIVSEDSVYHAVSQLRKAFAEIEDSRDYIRTVSKKGYSLVAPVRRTVDKSPERLQSRKSPKNIIAATIAILAIGFLSLDYITDAATINPGEVNVEMSPAIAVMPFLDLSPDKSQEYLGDGFADDLLNSLAQVDGLKVMARTSSFSFKNSNKTAQEIGNELNVGTIVEGSINNSDGLIKVTVQLINSENGFHIWSQSYERNAINLFILQKEIADQITGAMGLEAVEAQQNRYGGTNSFEAYEQYQQAVFVRGRYEIDKAVSFMLKAVEIDPNYVTAHGKLAQYYLLLRYSAPVEDKTAEWIAAALEHITIGKTINENDAQLQAAIGLYHWELSDGALAAEHMKRSLELDPSNTDSYVWLADIYKENLGEYELSDAILKSAYVIDPANGLILANLTSRAAWKSNEAEAMLYLEKLALLQPSFSLIVEKSIMDVFGRFARKFIIELETQKKGDRAIYNTADLLSSNFGLLSEAIRFSPDRPHVLLASGDAVAALTAIENHTDFDPAPGASSHSFGRLTYFKALILAGETERAYKYGEEMWAKRQKTSDGMGPFRNFQQMILVASLRFEMGDEKGARLILSETEIESKLAQKAGNTGAMFDHPDGLLEYYNDNKEHAIELLMKAIDGGNWPSGLYNEYYGLRDEPALAELKTAILAKQEKERTILLTWICAEDPEGYPWYPLPETCEKYLGADYKNRGQLSDIE